MTAKSQKKRNLSGMIILISVLVLAAVLVVTLHVEHIQKQKITLEQQKKALAPPGIMLSKINTDYYQGKVIGHVSCPRIGLDCDLVYGTTDGDLWKGAGLHDDSSLPGFATTPLIAGHARMYFKGSANAKKGDRITVKMPYGTYIYEIVDSKVMNKFDFDFSQLNEKNHEAIFYACYPFYKTSYVKQNRIFFYCRQISGPKVLDDVHGNGHTQAVGPGVDRGTLANFS